MSDTTKPSQGISDLLSRFGFEIDGDTVDRAAALTRAIQEKRREVVAAYGAATPSLREVVGILPATIAKAFADAGIPDDPECVTLVTQSIAAAKAHEALERGAAAFDDADEAVRAAAHALEIGEGGTVIEMAVAVGLPATATKAEVIGMIMSLREVAAVHGFGA